MAALNLSGKTSGFIKLTAPEVATNSTVELPNKNGILATLDDVGEGGGGGGGGVAQPPVAFDLNMSGDISIPNDTLTLIPLSNAIIDTDNGFTENGYVVKKSGLYDLSYSVKLGKVDDFVWVYTHLQVNNNNITSDNFNFDFTTNITRLTNSNSKVVKLEVGDKITLSVKGKTRSGEPFDCFLNSSFLSGHMVSSFGGVSEKEAVVFRAGLANDFNIENLTATTIPLDTVIYDTDNALTDGKFKPSVAGYYQVNGVVSADSPDNTSFTARCISRIEKNNKLLLTGSDSEVRGTMVNVAWKSQVSGIVYLDPENKWTDGDGNEQTGDYLTLGALINNPKQATVKGTATPEDKDSLFRTSLSAHLITGQSTGGGSASGDSIWTEEDGKAVYDGDIEVNGVTTGQGNNKNVKNTALGINALSKDVGTGAVDAHGSNTAIGDRSMQDLTTGYFNTAIGTASLQKAVDGYNNTALGRSALNYCTSGFDNIGIGREALFGDESRLNTGNSNIGIGTSAIHDCSTGEKNVGIGRSALHFLTSGDENVAIGQGAGNNLETGNNNILIGSGVDTEDVDSQNQTVIGNDRTVKALLRGGLEVKSHLDTVSLTTNANGRVSFPETPSLSTTTQTGNVHMTDTGALYLSTASTYSAEEVDKKLAIKDKLIEKLSARLDELEKRVK
jgi:hypothetical protein